MSESCGQPLGYRLTLLSDQPGAAHIEARRFCLDTILEFYGFDYRPGWHADLDSLLLPVERNQYGRAHDGSFWTLHDALDRVAATGGIRHLGWKPNIVEMFPSRYARGEEIASLWRIYVRKDVRGRGLGRWMTRLCEEGAHRFGYRTMYLHASSDTPATLAFWNAVGYEAFGRCDTSTHFDKRLGT